MHLFSLNDARRKCLALFAVFVGVRLALFRPPVECDGCADRDVQCAPIGEDLAISFTALGVALYDYLAAQPHATLALTLCDDFVID